MIKVVIVDDQKIFREGLKMLISQDTEIVVVGLCEQGKEAVEMIPIYKPDIILMDIQMPVMNGVEAVKRIKESYKDIDVIMLTTFHNDHYITDAIRAGALGYLLKDTEISIIIDAIKTVHQGGVLMDSTAMKVILNQFMKLPTETYDLDVLTEREKEICYLIAEGLNNKEISEKLFLGEGTIKNHITKVLQKLELRDRTQLAIHILKSK
ncbi:MAG: response regulator transcription factor [Clostridiales bacterium]|nr:response regulator transcription factor [Clostridiales bacterium]